MSYSYSKTFRSKRAALADLKANTSLPRLVRELLIINVSSLQPSDGDGVVRINASGHSCELPSDYDHSTHAIDVMAEQLAP